MQNYSQQPIKRVFQEKEGFLVIGLTGQKGSGCTTACNLMQKSFKQLSLEHVYPAGYGEENDLLRDKRILYRFAQRNWEPFDAIYGRDVILSFILSNWDIFVSDINQISESIIKKIPQLMNDYLSEIKIYFDEINEKFRTNKYNVANKIIERNPNHEIRKYDDLFEKRSDLNLFRDEWIFVLNKVLGDFIELLTSENNKIDFLVQYNSMFLRCWDNNTQNHDLHKYFQTELNEKSYIYVKVVLPMLGKAIHKMLGDSGQYTKLFQIYGNRIRFHGSIEKVNFSKVDNIESDYIYEAARRMNTFIKSLRHPIDKNKNTNVRVVIDSIKNFYEAHFLRSRYSAFYLISITKDNDLRIKGLRKKIPDALVIQSIDFNERPSIARKQFSEYCKISATLAETDNLEKVYENLNKIEQNEEIISRYQGIDDSLINMDAYAVSCCKEVLRDEVRIFAYANKLQLFYLQDIEACIQDADIFIPNNEIRGGKEDLKYSILRYICLMLHPGLVTPSPVERCMQIAYTAKVNPGCISRQVGAVVTDSLYNVLSLGWNDVPHGQTSCNRRNLMDISRYHDHFAYSNYENDKDSTFRSKYLANWDFSNDSKTSSVLSGLPASYCFKDAYVEITGDKNQVHTRAMHGEERALLLCNKEKAIHGCLFTTSSPCELCAKNAKEHDIKLIYYIEPYPGISQNHICDSGNPENRAQFKLFEGAIGRAYTQLFTPLMPYKDELELRGIHQFKIEVEV